MFGEATSSLNPWALTASLDEQVQIIVCLSRVLGPFYMLLLSQAQDGVICPAQGLVDEGLDLVLILNSQRQASTSFN